MANAAIRNRLYDGNTNFRRVNSFLAPYLLGDGEMAWAYNCSTKGKQIRTRPGFKSIFSVTCGKAQGLTLFTPTNSKPNLVAAISGRIWVSPWPFNYAYMLPNIQFDPNVDQVIFCETVQAKSLTTLVPARAILMMQDSRTAPAFWDGAIGEHVYPFGGGTVLGFQMEWIGNRLWVARDRQLYASDIFDPLHFTEIQYLSQGGSFQAMDGQLITALKRTADSQQLLVFTAGNTTRIAAGFTDRSQWSSTQNFVQMAFPGVGCVGPKAVADVSGELFWFSDEGVRRYNAVGLSVFYAKNMISSHEMARSFDRIGPLKSRICAFAFSFYAGFSVPVGSQYNRHTWILDTSSTDVINNMEPLAWNGVWTGTFPAEWVSRQVYDRKRLFFISQDPDAVRVWEAFDESEQDDGQEILAYFESRAHDFNQIMGFKRLRYAEEHLSGVAGMPKIDVAYKNEYACWRELGERTLCSTDFMDISGDDIPAAPVDDQNRYFRTQEAIPVDCTDGNNEGGAPYMPHIGLRFQQKVRWTGRLGIDRYKMSADEYQELSTGDCPTTDVEPCITLSCEDEEPDYISNPGRAPYYYGPACGIVSF